MFMSVRSTGCLPGVRGVASRAVLGFARQGRQQSGRKVVYIARVRRLAESETDQIVSTTSFDHIEFPAPWILWIRIFQSIESAAGSCIWPERGFIRSSAPAVWQSTQLSNPLARVAVKPQVSVAGVARRISDTGWVGGSGSG